MRRNKYGATLAAQKASVTTRSMDGSEARAHFPCIKFTATSFVAWRRYPETSVFITKIAAQLLGVQSKIIQQGLCSFGVGLREAPLTSRYSRIFHAY